MKQHRPARPRPGIISTSRWHLTGWLCPVCGASCEYLAARAYYGAHYVLLCLYCGWEANLDPRGRAGSHQVAQVRRQLIPGHGRAHPYPGHFVEGWR